MMQAEAERHLEFHTPSDDLAHTIRHNLTEQYGSNSFYKADDSDIYYCNIPKKSYKSTMNHIASNIVAYQRLNMIQQLQQLTLEQLHDIRRIATDGFYIQ